MYICLYKDFINLLKKERNSEQITSMRCQVHIFFIFILLIIFARAATHTITTVILLVAQNPQDYVEVQWNFYLNAVTDIIVNILVLYYRLKTKMNADFQKQVDQTYDVDAVNKSGMGSTYDSVLEGDERSKRMLEVGEFRRSKVSDNSMGFASHNNSAMANHN